jgi:hypothetical protein
MARATTKIDLLTAANEQFGKLQALIASMTDDEQTATFLFEDRDRNVRDVLVYEELFAKKAFSWTGTTTLGAYCVSATSSHYDWAIKKLKNHLKTYRAK